MIKIIRRIRYWNRIFSTYIFKKSDTNLSFWHGEPELNENANFNELDQYYMMFIYKANYSGESDGNGVPKLNYKGDIGLQYNPIAIAQWGLGNYNLWCENKEDKYYNKFIASANWLVNNIELNKKNISVWNHYFNWTYKETLISPWYSGLAQGQGLSVLCRAYNISKNAKYLKCAEKIYESFLVEIKNGGVTYIDENGNVWIEEYIMEKSPTHILNGFIWALWGIYDYWLLTKNYKVKKLFDDYIQTLLGNINKYDIGHWSLYEISNLKIKMRASLFYHKLHIVQLKILYKMTNKTEFNNFSNKWEDYLNNKFNIFRAVIMKILFKILYY